MIERNKWLVLLLCSGLCGFAFGEDELDPQYTVPSPALLGARAEPLLDTDGDTLYDLDEVDEKAQEFTTDPFDVDSDDDELKDDQELKVYLTIPTNPDTDGGLLIDGWEIKRNKNPFDATDDSLHRVLFATDQATLDAAASATLDLVVGVLQYPGNEDLKVQVRGFTDHVGDHGYNMVLSADRSQAVWDYLLDRGIASTRLLLQYWGENQPIGDNLTPKGRQKNRRVELTLVR